MAWSPESHGLIERVHLEFHRILGKSIELVIEARAEDWPDYVSLVELVWRSRHLESGEQPLALSRGYYATTPLQSALGALHDIPAGLAQSVWMKSLLATHRLICTHHNEVKADLESAKLARTSESKGLRPRTFRIGDYVLLCKGGPRSKLHGKGEGPWKIEQIHGDAINLADPWTGRSLLDSLTGLPDNINVDRLMKFTFLPEDLSSFEDDLSLDNLGLGKHVMFLNQAELFVGEVLGFRIEEWVEVLGLSVPEEENEGGWTQKPWTQRQLNQTKVQWNDIICLVSLNEQACLTVPSLEKLRKLGANLD